MLEVFAINYGVGLIGWIIAGAVGGWLAGQVRKGGSYGLIGNVVVGIIGALLLGVLLNALNLFKDENTGLIGTIAAAFVGALLLTTIVNAITGQRKV